jgi:cytidylate kinase
VVVTLSRQAESGGDEIASLVAERLRLKVADRAILERIAQQEGLPVSHLAVFDEAVPGAIEAVIAEWTTSMSHAVYLRRLVRTLLLLEWEDDVLIMGRGAAFVLTDPGTFHVRVVAPMPCRIARLMRRQAIGSMEVERMLKRSDASRARFVREAFSADIDGSSHYDLTLNTAELAIEDAVQMIALGAQRKAVRRAIAAESSEEFVGHVLRFRRRPRLPRVSQIIWEHCERRARG